MRLYYSGKFAREYKNLPLKIKKRAEKQGKIFSENPFDPRLKTHKLSGTLKDFWIFSIGQKYRIIFEFVDKKTIWFHSAGNHSIYQ